MNYHLFIPILWVLISTRGCDGQSFAWEAEVFAKAEAMRLAYEQNPPQITAADFAPFSLENLLPLIEGTQPNDNECIKQLTRLGAGLKIAASTFPLPFPSKDPYINGVAKKVLDASGKPGGPGVLRGRTDFMGLYHECIDIKYRDSEGYFEGDYFRVYFDIAYRPATMEGACPDGQTQWGVDMCLPKVCTRNQTLKTFSQALSWWNYSSSVCRVKNINDNITWMKPGGYIVAVVMLFIFALCFIMGAYDYAFGHVIKDNPLSKTLWFQILLSFSFYRNVCEILNTKGCNKPGQIGPLNSIRFFSMLWVIMSHIMALMVAYSANPLDVIDVTRDTMTTVFTNSHFSVDSFFFISGLLLAFIWFKDFNKNKRRAMSPLAWVMFYVHRILRLSPPYFFVILFFTFVYQPWQQGAPLMLRKDGADNCVSNWWIDLVYLTNFIDYNNQCYLVAWYLATDLQIYIFTPLILIPLAINRRLGFLFSFLIFALSTGANIYEVLHYYYPLTPYQIGIKQDPRLKNSDYNMMMYNAPWIRCAIYIQGMWAGWFLQNWKGSIKLPLNVKRLLNVVLWLLTFVTMAATLLVVRDWIRNEYWPVGWRAFYSAVAKPAWGLCLTWIIFSCFYGYGGPINRFMSWNIWVPFGRLTYCCYLVHITVVLGIFVNHKSQLVWNNFFSTFMEIMLPSMVVSYFVALLWSTAFEISIGKVEMLLIGGLRGRPAPGRTVAPKADAPTIEKAESPPVKVEEKTIETTVTVTSVYPSSTNGNVHEKTDKDNWT